MDIASAAAAIVLGTAGLSIVLFLLGFFLGRRMPDGARGDRSLRLSALLILIVPVLASLPLAQRVGSLIVKEALLFSVALDFSLLAGWLAGQRQQRSLSAFNAGVALLLLAVALFLVTMFQINRQVATVATQLGLGSAQKYEPEKNKDCPENLKSLYVAFTMYAESWDALPPAANWLENEEIASKIRQNEWMHCPEVSNRQDDNFGYAYNEQVAGRALNGKPLKDQPDAANTPLLYDSTELSKSARDAVTSLPKPGRHGGRNNILYLDGSVRAVE